MTTNLAYFNVGLTQILISKVELAKLALAMETPYSPLGGDAAK